MVYLVLYMEYCWTKRKFDFRPCVASFNRLQSHGSQFACKVFLKLYLTGFIFDSDLHNSLSLSAVQIFEFKILHEFAIDHKPVY